MVHYNISFRRNPEDEVPRILCLSADTPDKALETLLKFYPFAMNIVVSEGKYLRNGGS